MGGSCLVVAQARDKVGSGANGGCRKMLWHSWPEKQWRTGERPTVACAPLRKGSDRPGAFRYLAEDDVISQNFRFALTASPPRPLHNSCVQSTQQHGDYAIFSNAHL